jgi:hypothetical protein
MRPKFGPAPTPKPAPTPTTSPTPEEDDLEEDDVVDEVEEEEETPELDRRQQGAKKRSEEAYRQRTQRRSEEAKSYMERAIGAEGHLKAVAEQIQKAGAKDLPDMAKQLTDARVQVAFLRETAGQDVDLDADFKLLDNSLVAIGDAGEITGMNEAVHNVLSRYPHLVNKEATSRATQPSLPSSGSPFNGPNRSNDGLDMATLAKKYPSLARRLGR